jgi:hypothetical protein
MILDEEIAGYAHLPTMAVPKAPAPRTPTCLTAQGESHPLPQSQEGDIAFARQ